MLYKVGDEGIISVEAAMAGGREFIPDMCGSGYGLKNNIFSEFQMPIYEYACKSCGHDFEVLQKMGAIPLVDCPQCGEPELKKLLSAPNFRLKGGGWYETDFKQDNQRNLAGDSSGESQKDPKDKQDKQDKNNKKPADKGQSAGGKSGSGSTGKSGSPGAKTD